MLLEVKHLKKIFKTRFSKEETTALVDIDFGVEEGEYIAIMGESGSGKTTLLNILSTLEKPTSGQVLLNKEDITAIKDKEISAFRRDHLGFVFKISIYLIPLTSETIFTFHSFYQNQA